MLFNLARMTTLTTGTGTITLGTAVEGYLSFAGAGVTNGQVVSYAIVDGAEREIGYGVYTSSGTTLTRATILASTNGGSAINLSGDAEVLITALAEDIGFRGAKAIKSGDETGANYTTPAAVPWGATEFDTDGFFSAGSPTRLTIPAGRGIRWVELTATVQTTANTASTHHTLYFQKNGVATAYGLQQGLDGGATAASLTSTTGPQAAADGDYWEVFWDEESDASITIESESSSFSIKVLG